MVSPACCGVGAVSACPPPAASMRGSWSPSPHLFLFAMAGEHLSPPPPWDKALAHPPPPVTLPGGRGWHAVIGVSRGVGPLKLALPFWFGFWFWVTASVFL